MRSLSGKNILSILVVLFVLAAAIWYLFLLKVSLTLEAPAPFTVVIGRENQVQTNQVLCAESPCTLELGPETYEISVASEGYFSETKTVTLSLQGGENIVFDLQKIPALEPLSNTELPTAAETIAPPLTLDSSGKLMYVDTSGGFQLIAEFFPAEETDPSQWKIIENTAAKAFLLSPKALYEVDIPNRRKFQLLAAEENETFRELRVFEENILLLESLRDTEPLLSFFLIPTRTHISFLEQNNANLLCQDTNNSQKFFFLAPEGTAWRIAYFTLENPVDRNEIASFPFKSEPEQLWCESPDSLLIQTADTNFRASF